MTDVHTIFVCEFGIEFGLSIASQNLEIFFDQPVAISLRKVIFIPTKWYPIHLSFPCTDLLWIVLRMHLISNWVWRRCVCVESRDSVYILIVQLENWKDQILQLLCESFFSLKEPFVIFLVKQFIICISEDLIYFACIIGQCSYSVAETWPDLKFVCYPIHVGKQVATLQIRS